MCAVPVKNRVLLVDDDALTLRIYCEGLLRQGYRVEVANEGLAAMQSLQASKPDIVVVDVLMPKFSGIEVLKYIRGEASLAELRVILLSNSYLRDSERPTLAIGAQRELLKGYCSPRTLGRVIQEVLAAPTLAQATVPPGAGCAGPAPGEARQGSLERDVGTAMHRKKFLSELPNHCAALRNYFDAFSRDPDSAERQVHLTALFRKVHNLTGQAGLAELPLVAQLSGAFEALLFLLMDATRPFSPSVMHTIATAVDLFPVLLKAASGPGPLPSPAANVLVVDDDPLLRRLVDSALSPAQLRVRTAESSRQAWELLQQIAFDLVLLDIDMPGTDGFELCRRLRSLPGYAQTPVLFVSGHADLQHRARALACGGDDLLAKPVLAPELSLKSLILIIKSRLTHPATVAS